MKNPVQTCCKLNFHHVKLNLVFFWGPKLFIAFQTLLLVGHIPCLLWTQLEGITLYSSWFPSFQTTRLQVFVPILYINKCIKLNYINKIMPHTQLILYTFNLHRHISVEPIIVFFLIFFIENFYQAVKDFKI